MTLTKLIRQDTTWSFGLLLLLASLLVFGAPSFFHFEDSEGGFFIFNYLIAIVYFVVLLGSGRLKRDRNGLARQPAQHGRMTGDSVCPNDRGKR